MRVDDQAVRDIISCVEEFDCYPFDAASPALRTLQSPIPASPELIRDFSTARQDGESKLKSFLDERIYAKEKSLYDRIKRSCRLTFARKFIPKLNTIKCKGFGAMTLYTWNDIR